MLFSLVGMKTQRVVQADVKRLFANPDQPRKTFDQDAIMELAESIGRYGVLQPLLVREVGGGYEIIAGERRWRAAKMAGLTTVPVIVRDESDLDAAAISLIENLQRQDLGFFEEAAGIAKLISSYDLTQEETATIIGKSQPTVANKLRLLKLPEHVRAKILEERLTERHARALLKLDPGPVQDRALSAIVKDRLTVSQSEKLIAKLEVGETLAKKKIVFKDVRIFVNTINKAVKVMRNSGIEAESRRIENDEYIEYTIKIPKLTGVDEGRE